MPEETCSECGKTISRRAKANIWNGEQIVCTPCLHDLESAVARQKNLLLIIGRAGTPWMVHDGRRQRGPYTTGRMIELLGRGEVLWEHKIWREGMQEWKPAMRLFTIPSLCEGRLELRDFGQGDGTYRPA